MDSKQVRRTLWEVVFWYRSKGNRLWLRQWNLLCIGRTRGTLVAGWTRLWSLNVFINEWPLPFPGGRSIFNLPEMPQDEPLIKALQAQNVAAFKTLVIDYSGDMVLFASRLLHDPVQANDTVNDLLLDLYNSAFHNATSPLRAFLFERIRLACKKENRLLRWSGF